MNRLVAPRGASPRGSGMPRLSVFVAVFGLLSATVSAQTISQVLFLPQTYYVGDVVEARIVVRSVEEIAFRIPSQLPDTEWVDFRSVQVVPRTGGYEIRVVFQPFFVGTRQLPAIDLDGFTVDTLSAVVSSLREEGELELEPIRSQILLPGTQLLTALIVLAALAIPFAILVAGEWSRRWFIAIRRRYRESRPYRTLQKGLRSLQVEMHELDGKRYYIRLLDMARSYLGGRLAPGIESATTGELDFVLGRTSIPIPEKERLIELFRFGDLVKFANKRVSVDDRMRHLSDIKDIAQTLHKRRKEDRDVGA
ncbi:MAG: hypothetical protein MI724_10620 [Spirochaetales bacterium]|nr:hypothetical protein [Spirochaetales bacterium]